MGIPLMVICILPSAVGMVPIVPLTPSTPGMADVVVTGGQRVAQPPVQALLPESLASFAKK